MTNEIEIMADIKKLVLCCGQSIDLIAKKYGVSQDDVAKAFMEFMKKVLSEVKR